jgi:hypothetical protein
LLISDVEIFDLFQRQRKNIQDYLERDATERSVVLEEVVRLVTLTRENQAYLSAPLQVRNWRNLDGMNCIGRYVPDPNPRTPEEQAQAEAKRWQTRGQDISEIEVNIQLGTLTLNTAQVEHLDLRICAMEDFQEVFGQVTQVACAGVKLTTKRKWVRLVGRRYDLQLWQPDDRVVPLSALGFNRVYNINGLSAQDVWVMSALEPIRKAHKLLPTSELHFLDVQNKFTQTPTLCARLAGYDADAAAYAKVKPANPPKANAPNCYACNAKFGILNGRRHCKNCGHSLCDKPACSSKVVLPSSGNKEIRLCSGCKLVLTPRKYTREFVVLRVGNAPTVVHMYKIIEHGRRSFRTLVYSSDWRFALHEMPPLVPVEQPADLIDRLASAEEDYQEPTLPSESLVIMRNLGNSSQDLQTYIPNRLLAGLMPDSLLDRFSFWQNPDDSLTGYPLLTVQETATIPFVLRVHLVRDPIACSCARIVRAALKGDLDVSPKNAASYDQRAWAAERTAGEGEYTLLNLLYATEGS